jgi:hypothetical protein
MNKKLFALASVSALAGLVATAGGVGCTTTLVQPAANPTDAGTDATTKPPVKSDAGPKGTGGDEEEPEPTGPECYKAEAIDGTEFAYTKAGITPGACSSKELADFSAGIKAAGNKLTQALIDALSESCQKCVFTKAADDAWGVFIEGGDNSLNTAGCFERYGNVACATAYHQVEACAEKACSTCEDQQEYSDCVKAANKGPCSEEQAALQSACSSKAKEVTDNCLKRAKRDDGSAIVYAFEVPWLALCGGSAESDAGADADTDAGSP